jgi:gluconolactonase
MLEIGAGGTIEWGMKFPLHLVSVFLPALGLPFTNLAADEGMESILDPGAKVERLGTDMAFTEGSVWLPAERAVVFSDIPNSRQMRWSRDGGLEEYRKVEATNGNVLDRNGKMVSCQHGARNVVRWSDDGKAEVVVDAYEGKKLNSPNDLAIQSDGTIWFTDPSYGRGDRKAELDGCFVFQYDEKSKQLAVVCRTFDMPNGIAFSPDEKRIYISDTGKIGKIRAYDVPTKKGIELGEPVFEIDVRCDGMCVDAKGNIYATAEGGIHVFGPSGKIIGLIPVEEHPANVCFGGEDFSTLFITARKSLYSIKVKNIGNK